MTAGVRVQVHLTEVRKIPSRPDVMALLMQTGEQVAEKAAQLAPRRTGALAESIHAEKAGNEVHVGWSSDVYYGRFQELGTSKMPANPFLRPALDAQYTE